MVLFSAAALMAAFSGPRHIHLSLAPTSSEMRVAWSTFEATHFNGAYYTSSGNCSIDSCGESDVQWSVRMTLSDSQNATGSRTLFKVDLGNKNHIRPIAVFTRSENFLQKKTKCQIEEHRAVHMIE